MVCSAAFRTSTGVEKPPEATDRRVLRELDVLMRDCLGTN